MRCSQSRVPDVEPLAPSPVPNALTGRMVGEATEEEIEETIESFAQGARRVYEAGFDGVHIHAAEGQYDGFLQLKDAAQRSAQLVSFDLAERRLAEALEDFGNAETRGFLDAVVEIDEAPGELPGEKGTDGGLAGTHEAGEAKHLYAGLLGA